MTRRVLVTGANGFIGRHAVDALRAGGHEVIALTRKVSAVAASEPPLLSLDLLDLNADLAGALASARADTLLHLAWETRHGYFWSAPENIDWVAASLRLVRAFAAAGGQRVVGAGTCAEYDVPADGRCDARSMPCRPTHLYGAAKDALRRILESHAPLGGLSFSWGRIFHVLGPGEAELRLVPSAIAALAEGRVFPTGTGARIRDFMDVRDCGRAFARLALSDYEGPINIASGRPMAIGDLLRLLAGAAGRPDLIGFGLRPEAANDLPDLFADISPLEEALGFRPRYALRDTLKEAITSTRNATAFSIGWETGCDT